MTKENTPQEKAVVYDHSVIASGHNEKRSGGPKAEIVPVPIMPENHEIALEVIRVLAEPIAATIENPSLWTDSEDNSNNQLIRLSAITDHVLHRDPNARESYRHRMFITLATKKYMQSAKMPGNRIGSDKRAYYCNKDEAIDFAWFLAFRLGIDFGKNYEFIDQNTTNTSETVSASLNIDHIRKAGLVYMNAVQKEKFLASEPDTVGLYLNDSQEVPLLTAEEEVTLAKRIEAGRWARETLPNVATNNDRHVQKRIAKLTTVIENGEDALEHLIRANSGLVISVAKRYQGRGVPFSDLIQEGNIGLIRSTKKFDYRKGNKFSTYATWWIRQAVSRAIADQARTIRVPVHLGGQIKRVYKTQLQLQQMLDRDPTIEEIADYLHKNPAKVERLLEISRRPISLSQTHDMGDGDSDEFGEFIEDTNVAMPEEETDKNILKAQLIEILDHLPPRERRVLELRYGLIDGQAMTLGAVGLKMGVTRERVRQIEAKALKRLQYSSIKRQLT